LGKDESTTTLNTDSASQFRLSHDGLLRCRLVASTFDG